MSELPLKNVKVGDKICVIGYLGPMHLIIVDRVTPSGRVVTKRGTFAPDGYRYGDRAAGWCLTRARLATEDDVADIYRARLVSKIEGFHYWDKLSPDDLKAVAEIVQRYT